MTPSTAAERASDNSRRRKRVRDPEAHRAAILAAARVIFEERGYTRGTIREIARRAGVTHGLVMRHFPTKKQLFVSSLLANRVEERYDGPVGELPGHIARRYVENIELDGQSDRFIALVRSAGDVQVAQELLQEMRKAPADAFFNVLDIPDLEQRGDLVGALLIGVTFSRYILAEGPLASLAPDELVAYLSVAIRAILLEPLSG